MKYAVEMGSGATIYIPGFARTGSSTENLIARDSQTHRQHGDRLRLLLNESAFPCVRDSDTRS
jgi:hypothetical protein